MMDRAIPRDGRSVEPLALYNLSPERVREETPLWPGVSLAALLAEQVGRTPDAIALEDEAHRLTFAEAYRAIQATAAELIRRGVQAGDIVAYQLPSSLDGTILYHAIVLAGAVASPIAMLYRAHDLGHILGLARPALVVSYPEYRGVPHADLLRQAGHGAGLPADVWTISPGQLRDAYRQRVSQPPDPSGHHPNDPLYVVWTSGTTGEAKGVIHTSNTGLFGVTTKLKHMQVGAGDTNLIMTPVAHAIGVYALNMLALGVRLIVLERWDPARAIALIGRLRPTFSAAPATFLLDLLRSEALPRHDLSSLRVFSCGGAPIPPTTIELAARLLPGCSVLSSYGTSEEGSITSVAPQDARELSVVSDGRPLPHVELRIVGPDRQDLPAGQPGDLLVRTPGTFAGYLCRPEATREAFVDGTWRWTGDQAVLRPDGAIRITGRTKDIVVRGGLNIPVVQVENALLRQPVILSAAIVAMPDERLGERACVYLVTRGGIRLTLEDVRAMLQTEGIARSYWPERVEIVPELPMTASGKVQKFRLREQIAEALQAEQARRQTT